MHTLEQLYSGELQGLRRLTLTCGLREFPEQIFTLADTLEVLDLSDNLLSSLPDDLPRLHKLRVIFCSGNRFTTLPEVLGRCTRLNMLGFRGNQISVLPPAALPPSLRWLILTDNRLHVLPAELGRCTQLQKLMLSGNQLQTLPDEMAACTRLELLRIAANRFERLPEWLFKLPRLAWLAYADNPVCATRAATLPAQAPIAAIAWDELEIQQQLGEGASGVIYRALWRAGGGQLVAVKLFKGMLTSDGSPHSEMACHLAAGEQENLLSVHGKIHGHPAAAAGLVMPLVDEDCINLAGPPSLESCTRDVYSADLRLTEAAVLRMALGVASAARHLHARGILHGDLYAHNILYAATGRVLLGDFGAASVFAPDGSRRAQDLQRIEVFAFSCLLEELLERCAATEALGGESRSALDELASLQKRCGHSDPAIRPLFGEIVDVLQGLQTA